MRLRFERRAFAALACCALVVLVVLAVLPGCGRDGADSLSTDRMWQAIKTVFDSIKPDALRLKGLTPGVSTLEQVRAQMGQPETERVFEDGSRRLEYPRGPAGLKTWMVDVGANGRLVAVTQALTAQNFAQIRLGMNEDAVRQRLGKPGQVAYYRLKKETVWSWKWEEGGVTPEAYFNVHFGPDGRVSTTSRSDVLRGH